MKLVYIVYPFDHPSKIPALKNKMSVHSFIYEGLKSTGVKVKSFYPKIPWFTFLYRIKKYLILKLFKKNYFYQREPKILKHIARQTKSHLKTSDYDFAIGFGSLTFAFIDSSFKFAFWSDATFENMVNYQKYCKNISDKYLIIYQEIEKNILTNASNIFLASDFATKEAINFYKVSQDRVHEIPFGGNIIKEPDYDLIKSKIEKRDNKLLKLIFVGRDWAGKGGDFALDVTKKINELGIKCELSVIGCTPEVVGEVEDYVKIHGLLDKNNPEEFAKIEELYTNSHFHFLPTKAESFGHVFCEANAYGLPNFAPITGGIPSVIKNGVNGYLFNLDDSSETVARLIINTFSDFDTYRKLCRSSLNEYHTRLNWKSASKKVVEILELTKE